MTEGQAIAVAKAQLARGAAEPADIGRSREMTGTRMDHTGIRGFCA